LCAWKVILYTDTVKVSKLEILKFRNWLATICNVLLQGINFNLVDESEVQITVGGRLCIITSYTNTAISCLPPQSDADVVVSSFMT